MEKEEVYYEFSYLVKPDLPEEEITTLESSLKALIQDKSGVIESWDLPKRRRIFYHIQGVLEVYFGALRFTIAPEKIAEIEEQVKKIKEIIRHLIVKWQKIVPPRTLLRPLITYTPKREEQKRTEEATIDKKLEEILGT